MIRQYTVYDAVCVCDEYIVYECVVYVTDKKATTPKRRRNVLAGAGSPTPGSTPKTPSGLHRIAMPLSERQQLALLMQMTAEKTQQAGTWMIGACMTCADYLNVTRRQNSPCQVDKKFCLLKQLMMFCHMQPILRCVNTFVLEILVAKV